MLRNGVQNDYISRRINLPTTKNHASLVQDVEARIKAQSFFSARVAEAHILDRLRTMSDAYSRGEISLGEARNKLKDFLKLQGYDPRQSGLRNLASTARLNLILKQNAAMAKSAGEWARMHDPDAMKVFPYVRYHARNDRRTRGEHAHLDGKIFRKDDPFLKTHTPPWEFNCRCWLEEITEKAAKKTPELIQKPTPLEEVKVESRSGFSFDPEHAFETFDCGSIHDPERRANVIDDMAQRFPEVTQEIYRSNGNGYLEGKASELKRRFETEAPQKVFPDQPKEFLNGKKLKQAEEQARNAVPAEVMKRTDDKIREKGADFVKPFMHYSSRPGDSENNAVRQAKYVNGVLDWTGVNVSDERKDNVKKLENLLNEMPKFRGTVYRGCSFDSEKDRDWYVSSLMIEPENLKGFVSTTPDPIVAKHYASAKKYRVIVVVPNSKNAVYFGPHSRHPEDEEALLSHKFYLKGLTKYENDGIIYIMAEETRR